MYEKLFEECGLTRNESKVYLSLLRLAKAKSGEIIKEAGISGGKIYETLNKLIDKGLVKSLTENGIKRFIANEPKALIDYIKEKEKSLHRKEAEIEKLIPSLRNLRNHDEVIEGVSLVKGARGVSAIVYKSLENSSSIKIMGVRSSKNERYNNFWRSWHRERVKSGKKAKILFSDKNTEYWNFFKKLKLTEIKELPHFVPSAIMIIDKEAFLFSYEEDIICVHINTSSIASSLSVFFDELWAISIR